MIMATVVSSSVAALCPGSGTLPAWHPPTRVRAHAPFSEDLTKYAAALGNLDLAAVREDLKLLFTMSQPEWPAGAFSDVRVRDVRPH